LFNYQLIILSAVLSTLLGCSEYRQGEQSREKQNAMLTNVPELLSLSGFISYQEPLTLTDDAILSIKIEDVAKQDVAAEVIAEQRIAIQSDGPWAFTINYDPAKLKHNGRYVLRARLETAGKLRFINSTPPSAFNTQEPINILLSPLVY
jgi:putative lipoprotein